MLLFVSAITNIAFASLKGSEYENEAALLVSLGILPENAVTQFNEDSEVTRQTFLQYAMKAIGETDATVSGYEADFTDYKAVGYVAKAYKMGYINGCPDGSFRPSQPVTRQEAIKIILDIAGYKPIVEFTGHYPDAYLTVAGNVDLTDGVEGKNTERLLMKDAIMLFYNMMKMPVTAINNGTAGIQINENESVMMQKFDVYRGEGIITANSKTSLISPNGGIKGCVEINGEIYETKNSNAQDYLGYYVEYFYRSDDEGQTIVYADPSKKSEDIRMYAEQILEFSDREYVFLDRVGGSKESKEKVDLTADVIYNGKAMPEINNDDIYVPENGYVTLIDNDKDGVYDVVSIVDKNIVVLNYYDSGKYIFYDRYAIDKVIIDPDNKRHYINIQNVQGRKLTLNELGQWDVLEIAQSEDGIITDILVCRETVSGKITSMGEDEEGYTYITLNDSKYRLGRKISEYLEKMNTPLVIGKDYEFVLDSDSNVAGVKINSEASDGGFYGYFIKAMKIDDNNGEALNIKLLTKTGEIKTCRATNKLKVDGIVYKNIYDAYLALPQSSDLIYYYENQDGYIYEVDTLNKTENETDNSLVLKATASEKYSAYTKNIEGKVSFNENSLVFSVPADAKNASEDDFSVIPAVNYFTHYETYTVTGYSKDKLSVYSDAIVMRASAASSNASFSKTIYLIQDIVLGLNSDEELVYKITAVNASGEREYETKDKEVLDNAKAIEVGTKVGTKKGDIVRLAMDSAGNVTDIEVLYRASEDKFYPLNNPMNKGFFHSMRAGLWDVYYKTDNQLRIVPRGEEYNSDNLENLAVGKIFVYEPEERIPYRAGAIDEIRDFVSTGEASQIFVRTNDTRLDFIVIYK